MKRKERKQQKIELQERLYRPQSKSERAAVFRARAQAAATVVLCLSLLAGAVALFLFYRASHPTQAPENASETTETPSHTVIIDPGHGGSDFGAAINDEISEADATMIFAKELGALLGEQGYAVVYTRDADLAELLTDGDRLTLAEKTGADCMISLHTCEEAGVYYSLLSDTTERSAILAGYLGEAQAENTYTITRPKGIPCVRINDTADKDASSIAEGIMAYVEKFGS